MDKSLALRMPQRENIRFYMTPHDLLRLLQEFVYAPQVGWKRVLSNSEQCTQLFEKYVFFLAAIPCVSRFIGQVVFAGAPFFSSLLYAIVAYLCSLLFLLAATFIAFRSVKVFDGTLSIDTSAKLVVYSAMPAFITGIFFILPPLSMFSILGLYSLYLFYVGVQNVTGVPQQKLMAYYMLNIVSWLVICGFLMDVI